MRLVDLGWPRGKAAISRVADLGWLRGKAAISRLVELGWPREVRRPSRDWWSWVGLER